jgi:hypothetical protein
MSEIDELSKVVAKFLEPLRLNQGDAKTILYRFAYLKQKLGTNGPLGIPDVKLLLTSVYCYIRNPRYGRKIMGPAKFICLCREFELNLNQRELWRYQKLYFQQGLYPYAPIASSVDYFEAAWYDMTKDLGLTETAKDHMLSLLKEVQALGGPRRAPGVVVAAMIYIVGKKIGTSFSQSYLAEYFGISEVTLRNSVKDFKSYMNAIQF